MGGYAIDVVSKIVGSIVVGLIVVIALWFRRRLMTFVSRVFGSVPVGGKWKTEIERNSVLEPHEDVVLYQFVRRVWGSQKTTHGRGQTFKVHGSLRGQMLSMLYEESSGSGFETGVILLTVDVKGSSMEGYEIEYHSDKKTIVPSKYRWTRVV